MRDWQGLARKVAGGKPLEQAAVEMGIPFDEVLAHARDRMAHGDALPYQMQLVGQNALAKGVEVLEELAGAGPRNKEFDQDTDLRAASELARIGIAALRMAQRPAARAAKAKEAAAAAAGQRDLFDLKGPWADLKTPGT